MTALAFATSLPTLATAMVLRDALTRAVTHASSTVERRNTHPILANVRLQGDGQTLFVTGTDLDIEIVVAIPAPADAHMDLTIPAALFKDILKGAPKADYVAFSHEGTMKTRKAPEVDGEPAAGPVQSYIDWAPTVSADFEVANYNLSAISSDNWPEFVFKRDGAAAFQLTGDELFDMLDAVQFAISTEETRYYLNGIFFHVVTPHDRNMPELCCVATDGHRMARFIVPAPDAAVIMPGVIIPAKTVKMILKLLGTKNRPAVVNVEVTQTKVRFQFDDVTITSKVVEGTFPDYERVTPRNNDKVATFNVPKLLEKLAAVSMIASERGGKAVKLNLFDGQCRLSVLNPDAGTATADMPIVQEFDGDFEIGFNARYLKDILDEIKPHGDTATMRFNDAGAPTVIEGERDGWLSVLMPMRV